MRNDRRPLIFILFSSSWKYILDDWEDKNYENVKNIITDEQGVNFHFIFPPLLLKDGKRDVLWWIEEKNYETVENLVTTLTWLYWLMEWDMSKIRKLGL